MRKLVLPVFLVLAGIILGLVLSYLVLLPANVYLFYTPSVSPNGSPFPGALFVYNTSTSTIEIWVDGVPEVTVDPKPQESPVGISNNTSPLIPREYKVSLKIPQEVTFREIGLVRVEPDKETWLIIKPDLSVKIAYTRWLSPNEINQVLMDLSRRD
jgi:hypothetical protein